MLYNLQLLSEFDSFFFLLSNVISFCSYNCVYRESNKKKKFIIIFSFKDDKRTFLLKEEKKGEGGYNDLLMRFCFVISEAEHVYMMRKVKE